MSSAPQRPIHSNTANQLSREEWWALFEELRLDQQPDYAEYGCPIAFFRKERESDTDLA